MVVFQTVYRSEGPFGADDGLGPNGWLDSLSSLVLDTLRVHEHRGD